MNDFMPRSHSSLRGVEQQGLIEATGDGFGFARELVM